MQQPDPQDQQGAKQAEPQELAQQSAIDEVIDEDAQGHEDKDQGAGHLPVLIRTCRSLARKPWRNSACFKTLFVRRPLVFRVSRSMFTPVSSLWIGRGIFLDSFRAEDGHFSGAAVDQVPVQDELQAAAIWATGRDIGCQQQATGPNDRWKRAISRLQVESGR